MLPTERHIVNGRTFASIYRPVEYAVAIERYRRSWMEIIFGWARR